MLFRLSMQLSLASFLVLDHDRWQLLTCKKLAPIVSGIVLY